MPAVLDSGCGVACDASAHDANRSSDVSTKGRDKKPDKVSLPLDITSVAAGPIGMIVLGAPVRDRFGNKT